ncbi:hypothetical protein MSAN_01514000 [Mycena sanguinolenta]|uniref:Uncharacterized protein n=1 Tax=Mycena sanguinolenta TaxID=230812 RepID=A0A8H7CZ46_9AGAR|nr:hypothetical protein MSAN_01514000 [Mycena sanguinolenta]
MFWSCRSPDFRSVRRVYTAKLEGCKSGHMTVAMYEGDGAEEAWSQDLAKYEIVRHPNIMQLYVLVSTQRLYAMVFYDELIPYRQFLRCFQHSPILSTYIMAYCSIVKTTEFKEATNYIKRLFRNLYPMDYDDLSIWIRPPAGELCLELAPGGPETSFELARWWESHVLRLDNVSLETPDSEDMIISSLSEDHYHRLYSQRGTCVGITKPLVLPKEELRWYQYGGAPSEVLPNSWIRYESRRRRILKLELQLWLPVYKLPNPWLVQANRIFAEIEEETHVEDYVCVDYLRFSLRIADECHIPEGYLFICPPQDLCTGTEPHVNSYQWPACPAYWSLDPSGADHLSPEDARMLGFPPIHIETFVQGKSWERSVYKGL